MAAAQGQNRPVALTQVHKSARISSEAMMNCRNVITCLGFLPNILLFSAGPGTAQSSSLCLDDACLSQVDQVFSSYDGSSPGAALAIVENGRIRYSEGYGMANLEYDIPITPTSIFQVGSLSKQFTAMCIILLQQQNQIAFQDDIREYLPEVPDFGEEITVSHLLYHTSGLRDQMDLFRFAGWRDSDLRTQEDVLGFVTNQQELNFAPGKEQLYSNTGYVLLAEAVERITGRTIREFAEENIFRPLGMTSTHFHDDHFEIIKNRAYAYASRRDGSFAIETPASEMVGSTGLFSTVEDLAKWTDNFTHHGVGGEDGVNLLLTRGKLDNGELLPFLGSGLAFSTYKGNEWVGFGGHHPGYRSEFVIFPEHNLSIIVLSNHENANLSRGRSDDLLFQVADIVIDDEHLIEERTESPPAPNRDPRPELPTLTEQQYSEYEGRYYSEELDVYYSWAFKAGSLFFHAGRLGEIPVNLTNMDEFSPGGGYLIQFIRDSVNEVSGFTFSSESVRKLLFQRVGEVDSSEE